MTGFIANLTELVAVIFQSFRLPALLPAITFVFANYLLFLYSGNLATSHRLLVDDLPFSSTGFVVLLIGILTYVLTIINYPLIRLFEGYPLKDLPGILGRWWQQAHVQYYFTITEEFSVIEKAFGTPIRISGKSDADDAMLEQYLQISARLATYYPKRSERILPTTIGNVIASAEDHSYHLYGIDAVALWPHLLPILEKNGYSKYVEQEKGALDFLLNTILLLAVFTIELLIHGILNNTSAIILLLTICGMITVMYILRQLSVSAAIGWGVTIRTAFDLYRNILRDTLDIKVAEDQGSERRIWEAASEFYGQLRAVRGQVIFKYYKNPADKDK